MPSERPSRVGLAWLGVTLVSVIAAVSGHLAQLLLLGGLVAAGIGLVALLTGRLRWARMNRRNGARALRSGLGRRRPQRL